MSYVNWWERYHHFSMKPEWLVFCTGVIPAISTAVRKLTTPGENVVIQTPVYNIFFNSILNNGRNVLENALAYDGEKYDIDWIDLENKLSNPQTTLMILCNPQNPVGIIWCEDTLRRIGELCYQYHVTVIADEIHCDLTAPGKEYIPFASVSEQCREISITCIAPTKAFNMAGIQSAAVMVSNEFLRHKMWRGLNTDEVAEPNVFAMGATIAAFSEGRPWLEELRTYIQENKKCVVEFLKWELPEIEVVSTDVTYLLWLDCSAITDDSEELAKRIRQATGLYLSDGAEYGGNGKYFLRMNVACNRDTLQDGLKRLKQGVQNEKKA